MHVSAFALPSEPVASFEDVQQRTSAERRLRSSTQMPAVWQGQPNQHKHELSVVPQRDDIIVGPFAVMVPFCKWVDVYPSAVLVHCCKWINDGHHAVEPLRDWSVKSIPCGVS